MIRRPPRSTLSSSSAASDVYKRQIGDLRDPGPVAEVTVDVIGRRPAGHRHGEHRRLHRLIHREANREPAASLPQCRGETVRGTGGVGSHQHLSLIHISEPTRLLSTSY